jgi:hypothetical protein
VADVCPQLIAFDAMDVQTDHHAVVQLGAGSADGERQPGYRPSCYLKRPASG